LQVENEKQEYLQLFDQKKKQDEIINLLQLQLQDALQYSVANKELYDNLKGGIKSGIYDQE
jgi:DNA sulfur modification protein DndD